ncbi:MAG: hypothetical protein ACOYNS_11145 [Bacteroidota bacterium]
MQTKPEWTNTQKNTIGPGYYYGIGTSYISDSEADTRAFIEFSRNVEVKVKSIFQREVSEEGKEFSDKTKVSTEMVSDVSLKGIGITERYVDTTAHTHFSLIKYRITEYDSMMQFQISREVALMKVRNQMLEEKRQEELRSQKASNQIEEEKAKEDLRTKHERLTLEQQRQKQEEQEAALHEKIFGEFLKYSAPEKAVTFRNGEISNGENTIVVKGGLSPFAFNGGMAAIRLAMFELSGTALFDQNKFQSQEAFLKIQIIPRVGEFTRTSLSIGAVQAIGMIADSGYKFKRSKYSGFIAGNVTVPEYLYSTFSFYADKRKVSIGATSFPFYAQFKNHFGFVIEANTIFDKDFRNKKGNAFVVNAGIRLQGSNKFSTQISFEDYKELNLSLEFQF